MKPKLAGQIKAREFEAWRLEMPSPNWQDLYDRAVLEPHPDTIMQRYKWRVMLFTRIG